MASGMLSVTLHRGSSCSSPAVPLEAGTAAVLAAVAAKTAGGGCAGCAAPPTSRSWSRSLPGGGAVRRETPRNGPTEDISHTPASTCGSAAASSTFSGTATLPSTVSTGSAPLCFAGCWPISSRWTFTPSDDCSGAPTGSANDSLSLKYAAAPPPSALSGLAERVRSGSGGLGPSSRQRTCTAAGRDVPEAGGGVGSPAASSTQICVVQDANMEH